MGAYIEHLGAAGFGEVEILSRTALSYEDLKLYPLYGLGVLDQMFSTIAPESRNSMVGAVTLRATKPAA